MLPFRTELNNQIKQRGGMPGKSVCLNFNDIKEIDFNCHREGICVKLRRGGWRAYLWRELNSKDLAAINEWIEVNFHEKNL